MSIETTESQGRQIPEASLSGKFAMVMADYAPAIALFFAVGISWEVLLNWFEVPEFLLPKPSVIMARVVADWPAIFANTLDTMIAAVSGFLLGSAFAIGTAIIFLYSRLLERAMFPWAIILKTVPIVAIAPPLTIWLGFGAAPKIVIAALVSFFPVLVNTVRGLRTVDPLILEFMSLISARKLDVFWHARIYGALPYMFSAMKIGSGSAVLGAIVAEFTGATTGIGTLIVNATFRQDSPMLFAAIFASCVATITLYYIVVYIESLSLFWPGATEEK